MFDQARDWLLPASCFLCEDTIPAGEILCRPCRVDLPALGPACPACGVPQTSATPCPTCTRTPPPVDRTVAVYRYAYPVPDLVRQMKYQRQLDVAREAGNRLADQVLAGGIPLPERLIPVPLHPLRRIRRGYNQSLEIARVIARRLGLPLETGLIRRSRHTRPQFDLPPRERARNLRGAFRLTGQPMFSSAAIVDDVLTTGITVWELARLLRRSGVGEIQVWAYARTA